MFTLRRKQYYPLNTITLSKSALIHNYNYLNSLAPGLQLAPVLKSNVYGHGLLLMAKLIDTLHPPFICVDSLYEAYELLKFKIKTPILIMGYVSPENLSVKKLPFSYAVYDVDQIDAMAKFQPYAGIHIFVDTGMNREGIRFDQLSAFLDYVQKFPGLRIDGLMSHFAVGGDEKDPFTQKQIAHFQEAQSMLQERNIHPKWIHIANSSGLLNHKKYVGKLGNMARCGIALYGIDADGRDKNLQPVLSLQTTLNQIKQMKKGEKAGYDFTFTAQQDMSIGILPLGYNDGVDRRLSNRGVVKIGNTYCPIIGRVSMNLTTIDISYVKNPHVGQKVIVFSNLEEDKNSIENAANQIDTIPYTLLTGLHASTKRLVVE